MFRADSLCAVGLQRPRYQRHVGRSAAQSHAWGLHGLRVDAAELSLLAAAAGEVILSQGREQPGLSLLSQKIPCTSPFPCLCSSPCPKPSFPWVIFLPVLFFISSYPRLFSMELLFCFSCPDTLQHHVQTTKLKKKKITLLGTQVEKILCSDFSMQAGKRHWIFLAFGEQGLPELHRCCV